LTREDQGLSAEATKTARTIRAEYKVGSESWRVGKIKECRLCSTRFQRTNS